jgi:DNA-directed RNA polymerase subunit RPC12/RpoP
MRGKRQEMKAKVYEYKCSSCGSRMYWGNQPQIDNEICIGCKEKK